MMSDMKMEWVRKVLLDQRISFNDIDSNDSYYILLFFIWLINKLLVTIW